MNSGRACALDEPSPLALPLPRARAPQNTQHDTTIFSLAALLCSTLIYNGSSSIDEASIQNLGFVANLTKHIRIKSGGGNADESSSEDLHRFFPAFLWVLRDFLLALVDDDGAEISADEYMETALAEQPGYDSETAARNRTRRFVKAFFRDRHCFTLVRPVEAEDALQQLETLPTSALRAEFVEAMAALVLCDHALRQRGQCG